VARLRGAHTRSRDRDDIRFHYDVGNDFYGLWLDARRVYSCAYFKSDDETLEQAQENKLDLICRKIGLTPGHTIFDIGCGWGSFLGFAAEKYGARCTGVTVSKEQVAYVKQRYAGLPVEPLLMDYRAYEGPEVDRIVSVGMFEHVGAKNFRTYFECARRQLKEDGIFLLHTIWENERHPVIDAWQDKYIFPNGDLPSLGEIASAVEGLFVVEEVHNFGADYERTLLAWRDNIEVAWPTLDADRYDERFRRMWRYYLASAIAVFRTRRSQLWQIVLSPRGVPGGYIAPR
jgi:cyclopropane-fatty-acyl-phospholipid synthase